jgi:hypothetical protein
MPNLEVRSRLTLPAWRFAWEMRNSTITPHAPLQGRPLLTVTQAVVIAVLERSVAGFDEVQGRAILRRRGVRQPPALADALGDPRSLEVLKDDRHLPRSHARARRQLGH